MNLPTVADVRAAHWAQRSVRSVRKQLSSRSLRDVTVQPPPELPPRSARAVHLALRDPRATCLVRALVLQAWYTARGRPRAVVIGVTGRREFAAHAWLDGDPHCHGEMFHEIHRLPPR